jgi:hypothetical protein
MKRKNEMLWFVSNCGADFRLNFAAKLSKHIPVNIYGKCKKSFYTKIENISFNFIQKGVNLLYEFFAIIFRFIFRNTNTYYNCHRDSDCEKNEYSKNKFYLSFESKNCSGYITENLWKILGNTHLIPVVIQPSKQFYEALAPPDSFIHAQDFDFDAQRLAEYLKLVYSDFNLYLKYQMWRIKYDIAFIVQQTEKRRLCELCTKLNLESSSIYYTFISKWFNNDCIAN